MKSKCATLANFIHQKDALIAINTIRSFYEATGKAPIYTVYDCFVSNVVMSEKMADIYKETLFQSLGNPMELINVFLFKNLITPNYPNYMNSDYADDKLEFMRQNPITPESHYLCKSDGGAFGDFRAEVDWIRSQKEFKGTCLRSDRML